MEDPMIWGAGLTDSAIATSVVDYFAGGEKDTVALMLRQFRDGSTFSALAHCEQLNIYATIVAASIGISIARET
jgi:hypothetical protein